MGEVGEFKCELTKLRTHTHTHTDTHVQAGAHTNTPGHINLRKQANRNPPDPLGTTCVSAYVQYVRKRERTCSHFSCIYV